MLAASSSPRHSALPASPDGEGSDATNALNGQSRTPATTSAGESGPSALPSPSLTPGDPLPSLPAPPASLRLRQPVNGHDVLSEEEAGGQMDVNDAEKTLPAPSEDDDVLSNDPVKPPSGARVISPALELSCAESGRKGAVPVLCPLCQGQCQGVPDLQAHLRLSHKVTPQGMNRLLDMVEIPAADLPPSVEGDDRDTGTSEDSRRVAEISEESREKTETAEDSRESAGLAEDDDYVRTGISEDGHARGGTPDDSRDETETFDVSADPSTGAGASESLGVTSSVTEVLGKLELDLERLEEAHELLVKDQGVADPEETVEEEETYRCRLCSQDFTSIDKLYAHQKELGHLELKQTPRGPGYLCWKKGCNQYFKTIEVLQTHFREIHVRKDEVSKASVSDKFSCQLCSAEVKDRDSLELHGLYHKVQAVARCSICQKRCKTAESVKSHITKEHGDLDEVELEDVLKSVDENLMSLARSPSYREFLKDYLGTEWTPSQYNSDSLCTDIDTTGNSAEGHSAEVRDDGRQKQTVPENACTSLKSEEASSERKTIQALLTEEDDEQQEEKDSLQNGGSQDQQTAQSDQEKSMRDHLMILSDQKSLEDCLNKDSIALDKYKDPSRKFKCHECKMGFTKKHYLAVHKRLTQHLPDSVLACYAKERYEDPTRPYKCELCKISFAQKNALLVHLNCVAHLHKVNKAAGSQTAKESAPDASVPVTNSNASKKTVTHSTTGTEQFAHASGLESASFTTEILPSSSRNVEQHKCDICTVSFTHKSNLETHLRSVAHQTRVIELHEQAVNGQVTVDQRNAAHVQQVQLMLKMMQQQQLTALTSQASGIQTIPASKSLPVSQCSAVFSMASTSTFSTSHLASAVGQGTGKTVLETDAGIQASSLLSKNKTSEKKSKESKIHFVDSKSKQTEEVIKALNSAALKMETTDVDFVSADLKKKSKELRERFPESKPKLKGSPNGVVFKLLETMDDVDSVSIGISPDAAAFQTVFKSEMWTNTTELPLPSITKTSDFPTNPVLAASVPITITQPRGFMGRFKPHLQRNLLENFGFECVMQFNENSQCKRKERRKGRKRKGGDQTKVSDNLNTHESAEPSEKPVDKDLEVKLEVDLPEINKSKCLECGHEFSSIFVLKTHEEEVHKKVVPMDLVEEAGETFRKDLEKKQPKTEGLAAIPAQFAPLTPSTTTSTLPLTMSLTTTTCTSTITTPVTDKTGTGSTKEDMPPPPPPLRQVPQSYDMSQVVPMLGMVSMPINLMSLGMQSSLSPIMSSASMDVAGNFPVTLGMMDSSLPSPQQTLQQSATAAQNQKRARTRINDEQLKILRAHFDINNSPTEAQISQMAELCGLPYKVIKHWFRNTLFKERQRNKDSPYNFSNPPSTTIDLDEYEKTGKIPATIVKMEDYEEDSLGPSGREESAVETELQSETQPMNLLQDSLPRLDVEDRRECESRSDTSTPSNVSSVSTTPTPAPLPKSGSLPCSASSILDAQAIVLAREAAAAAQNAASKRANRTRFTEYQVKVLQEYFEQNAYPKDDELDHLSKILNLNLRVIVVWFQNARQKARKVYENQPSVETKDSGSGALFHRTSSIGNHCKKCGAVFQRYFELIKHQKQSCFSENNNNKPLLPYTDDDSFSSCTSLEDSGLSDSLNLSVSNQKDRTSPSPLAKLLKCDKCDMSFSQAEDLQDHQKTHSVSNSFSHVVSPTSAFGMLQTLARQTDQRPLDSKPQVTSSPSTSTSTSTAPSASPQSPVTVNASKHKLEPVDSDQGEDQPKDKRLRTTILPEQLDYLYQKYQQDCNPSRKQLELIAEEVKLKKRVVQVWFQNTRARERKGQPRTHQQLIHKRCPFCSALFRARSALESHLVNKHPIEMANGDVNIDAIPDATLESPQPPCSVPDITSSPYTTSAMTDISKMFSPSGSMSPYLSLMPPSNLALGFPTGLSPSDSVQLSMQHLYEDAYKKYITELSGTTLSPIALMKTSQVPESFLPTPVSHSKTGEKQDPSPSTSSAADEDAPLDLSVPVKASKQAGGHSSVERPTHVFKSTPDKSRLHTPLPSANDRPRSRSPQERAPSQSSQRGRQQPTSGTDRPTGSNSAERSADLSFKNSFSVKSHTGPHAPFSSFNEKSYQEFDHNRTFAHENSFSESQSDVSDSQYRGDHGSSPSSPKSASSAGSIQKRHRTQMTSLQVRVMKLLFVDYKTPTMAECELVGHQIGLAKRVVQVWFQNARAKEKKFKQTMSKLPTYDLDYPKTAEECLLCHFKYSHKFTLQDHIFTQQHIDNLKEYIRTDTDLEREAVDSVPVSGSQRQPARDTEGKAWEKMSSSLSPQQMNQLQQGLNAAALGLSTALPGMESPFSLASLSAASEGAGNKDHQHKHSRSKKEKKTESPAPSTSSGSSKSGSSGNNQKDRHHHQKTSQQKQQQPPQSLGQPAADLAQMMALGGFLPGLDPSYLSYMYPGLPSFFPGLPPMPLLQPPLLPGAEYMFGPDPLSFGTPLPLLQIPPQAIKAVSEKVQDSKCVRTYYTQDCKTFADLRGLLRPQDASCFVESFVDVGYICKKCQMVYPARESCLSHQQLLCYPAGEAGSKTMVKLEQLQYQCRKCASQKFSTLSEAKSHCQLESHKSKVNKVNSNASSPASKPAPVQGASRSTTTTSASVTSSLPSLPQAVSKPFSLLVPSQTSTKPSTSSLVNSMSDLQSLDPVPLSTLADPSSSSLVDSMSGAASPTPGQSQTSAHPSTPGSAHSKPDPAPSSPVPSKMSLTADSATSAVSASDIPSSSSSSSASSCAVLPQASEEPTSPSCAPSDVSQNSPKSDLPNSSQSTEETHSLTSSLPISESEKEPATGPSPQAADVSPEKSSDPAASSGPDVTVNDTSSASQ